MGFQRPHFTGLTTHNSVPEGQEVLEIIMDA